MRKENPANSIHQFRLNNGLKVVLKQTGSTPIAAVDIWYLVGSRDEQPGKTGLAHLFEHMMFEGSENVGKGEHSRLINNVGGMVNASTSQDRTNYWEVVPSNQVKLALWLEADRMRTLDLSEENFENQRDTVKEERRMRVDNQPYMRVLYETKDELAYSNFAYRHSVIGSMDDLDRATVEDARRFHDIYYRPNNALLSVVGDINIGEIQNMVEEQFGDIPAAASPSAVDLTEPPQKSGKRAEFADPFAPFPALVFAYQVSPRTHPDFYALELLEKILFDGESSRLYSRLVENDRLALHLMGGIEGKFGPNLFFGFAQLAPPKTLKDLEVGISEEFYRVCETLVTDEELLKAQNRVKAEYYARQETVRSLADQFCFYGTLFDDPGFIYSELESYLAVSARKLRETAQKYFVQQKSSVIEIYPREPMGKAGRS